MLHHIGLAGGSYEPPLRKIIRGQPLRTVARATRPTFTTQLRLLSQTEVEDPDMNGGYISPPPIKRQFRDPHGDWWDKQERRNYGEPVHEDNDILGMFSPEEYTHVSSNTALLQIGVFITAVFGLCAVVYQFYPDKPSTPREFEDGLEQELGGPKAVRARVAGDE